MVYSKEKIKTNKKERGRSPNPYTCVFIHRCLYFLNLTCGRYSRVLSLIACFISSSVTSLASNVYAMSVLVSINVPFLYFIVYIYFLLLNVSVPAHTGTLEWLPTVYSQHSGFSLVQFSASLSDTFCCLVFSHILSDECLEAIGTDTYLVGSYV